MGKGGGGGHTPREAAETGRSKQLVKIVEILSEGEIQGLVDGVKSVFLDNTPIQAADDSYNFNNVEAVGRIGSQDQDVLTGFNNTENEVNVGTQIRQATPLVRTVTDSKVNRLRLTLGVSSLFSQNEQGDTNGSTVDFMITIGKRQIPFQISGKYSSQYLKTLEIAELPAVPFQIKVARLTADSKTQRLQNNTIWSSYTEIIDTEFAYPNTAVVGIKFDSEYFSNIPNRTYEIYGIKVKVPSNYDPQTRTYSGLWDGTFKIAWTNNPVWILNDFLTSKRYGLGHRLGEFGVDKWAFYQAAQYCDQLVPDGFGGTEPRFVCNAWLTEQRSAYDTISDICSIFRAMPVWNGQAFTLVMDRPSDPVWTYTNANVEKGEFTYTFSAMKSRTNAVQVEYADADSHYEKAIEYVADDEAIRKYGLNLKKVTAFGCTSRGQARRTGLWLLQTEKLETKTVTFTVGAEGLMHIPGDIINVADVDYAGTEIGGRVIAVKGRTVTLDREIQITENSYLGYVDGNAQIRNIKISRINGTKVTLDQVPEGLTEFGVWSLSTQQIRTQRFRALTVTEEEKGKYTIVALQHEPQKESIVDNGAVFEPKNTTIHPTPRIQTVDLAQNFDGSLSLSAEVTGGAGTLVYDVFLYKDGALIQTHLAQKSPAVKLENLANGGYELRIMAKNAQGQRLSEQSKTFTIDRPPTPTGVSVQGGLSHITLEWQYVDDFTQTEIWAAETNNLKRATRVAKVNARMFSHAVGAQQVRYYWLRHIKGINFGAFYQEQGLRGESGANIDSELTLLNKKLGQSLINEVFDTALPARNLELTKTVALLRNIRQYQGHKQIYNQADGKLYIWNGTQYQTESETVQASAIQGIIQPTQLAAIPTQQLTGKIVANQLATNSVGANAIAAHAITATHLAAGAITAGAISAGAVRADHLAAGQISADKLAIGLGGNLLANPIFSTKSTHTSEVRETPLYWHYSKGSKLTPECSHRCEARIAGGTNEYALKNGLPLENTFSMTRDIQSNLNRDVRVGFCYQDVPVLPGKRYIASCYLAVHRGVARLAIEERTKAENHYVKTLARTRNLHQEEANAENRDFSHYARRFVAFTAPESGLIRFAIELRTLTGDGDGTNPWLFALRPMLEECPAHASEPSAWQNAGLTAIHGGNIVTESITAEQLGANAVTANKIAAGAINANHIATHSITGDKVVAQSLTGNEIRSETIDARHIKANAITAEHLAANSITGDKISANSIITAPTIKGGVVEGTVITGGVIRGTHIEGITVEADNIIGDVLKAYSVIYNGEDRVMLTLDLPTSRRERLAYLMPVMIMADGISTTYSSDKRDTSEWRQKHEANVVVMLNKETMISRSVTGSEIKTLQGAFPVPANQILQIRIAIQKKGNGLAKGTRFVFFVGNA